MELRGKSVYDILLLNLKQAGRKTFIHRYIYMGEHTNETKTAEMFTKIINAINDDYVEERLTGMLLLYSHYFVHVIDGAEDALLKHLFMLIDEGKEIIGKIKLLVIYHHVNQRMFDVWNYRKAKPPILLEKIDPACDFQEMKRYLEMCIKKVYNLVIQLRIPDPEKPNAFLIDELKFVHSQYLPEYNLLDFLLNKSDVLNIKEILSSMDTISEIKNYLETVWPVRSEFIPYNVFEEEYNPIPPLT